MEELAMTMDRRDGPLSQLYAEHRLPLVRLGVLLLGDQGLAEDAVQDVFISVHRRAVPASYAYLRAAVVNRCRSVIRRKILGRRKVVPLLAEATPGADELLALVEEHREVLAALDRLPRRQREVLVLRYYGELSVAEVARTLDINEGTVKSTAARGLGRLRELLGGEA